MGARCTRTVRGVSRTDLAQLVDRVCREPQLMRQLADITDRGEFDRVVLQLAADLTIDVDDADVTEAIRDARTEWLARWV